MFEDERNHISYTSTGSIVASDETTITSVVGLYEIIRDLYPRTSKKKFELGRPTKEELDRFFDFCSSYLNSLIDKVSEYKEVFIDGTKKASDYRKAENNHLLFRPIGQRAFVRAVQLLISRGKKLDQSVDTLLKANMHINSTAWYHILWNPIDNKMITNKLSLAETQLLTLAGEQPRNNKSRVKLQEFIASLSK